MKSWGISTVNNTEEKLKTMLYAIVGRRMLGYANSLTGVRKSRAVRGTDTIFPKLRYSRRKADLDVGI